ncbi:MAG: hypothetical protein ABGY41_21000, partial [Candidatus Poribacteria bacterium]
MDDDLLAGMRGGAIMQSQDNGATWQTIRGVPGGQNIIGFTRVQGVLWAATARGLYALSGRRGEWVDLGLPPDRFVGLLTHNGVHYAVASREIYRTHDDGASWHRAGTHAIPADVVSFVADGDMLYAGTEAGIYRMALPSSMIAPPTIDVTSAPYRRLPAGRTSAGVTVRLGDHGGPWQWRLDEPFSTDGPAGGAVAESPTRATATGLTPGRIHRIYVTPTTEAGDIAYPSAQKYVTVFAPRLDWDYDQDLSRTRIAYWTRGGVRTVRPTGGFLAEAAFRVDDPLY